MSTATVDPAIVARWLSERALVEPGLVVRASFGLLLAERVRQTGAVATDDYLAILEVDPTEREQLLSTVAVPETWMFRYAESFSLLIEHATRLRLRGQPRLRMLSVGCATGEEPCSMAIAALAAGWPADRIEIEAIEQNRRLLEVARGGVFTAPAIRRGIPPWARQHLTVDDHGSVTVARDALACVRFHHGSALDHPLLERGEPCDAVFCRNLLIYLNPAGRSLLLRRLLHRAAQDALLFVGHVEATQIDGLPLEPVACPMAFALRCTGRSADDRRAARGPGATIAPRAERSPPRRELRAPQTAVPAAQALAASQRRAAPTAPAGAASADLAVARALADEGRLIEAESLVRDIHHRHGPTAEGLELLATLALTRDDDVEARRLLREALALAPDRETVLLQLAVIGDVESLVARRPGAAA